MEEAAALLIYQIIDDTAGLAYQLYSNWERDITPKALKSKVNSSNRIARVAVVGLGGVGKTTLIKTLTGCPDIDPRISTRGICPIILGREDGGGLFARKRRTSIIYCDTEGQRQHDFVASMLAAPDSDILHKGCFEALILVVDVKSPTMDAHRDADIVESVDWDRLNGHVQEWSDLALSVLFSVMSDQLKLCLIFVNKCNLVRELSGSEGRLLRAKIFDNLSPLIKRMQPRLRGVLLKTVIGSARDIEDVSEARQLIYTRALKEAS